MSKCEHGKQCVTRCSICLGHPINKGKCSRCKNPFEGETIDGKLLQTCQICRTKTCPHNSQFKKNCKICCKENQQNKPNCEHGNRKARCRLCGGSDYCSHGIDKYKCVCCKGNGVCSHNKRKDLCKLCNGCSFCSHGKRKILCKECDGKALCKSEWCETYGNPKYQGYCLVCFIHLFPDEPNTRNYKTKEKDVVDRITQSFSNFTWVADKKVKDGCSLRRPDLLLDMGSHIIIVEIDENKHTNYDCSCEHRRLMELSQDLHHRPIVFIRFNPDDYTNQDGEKVKSCWKLNKLGVLQVINKTEWEERIQTLTQQIQYWINNPTEKTIEIIELFY